MSGGGQEDWVRCMELLDARTLLLATNRGRVHRVGLAGPAGEESWSTVYATAGAAPLFARGVRGRRRRREFMVLLLLLIRPSDAGARRRPTGLSSQSLGRFSLM